MKKIFYLGTCSTCLRIMEEIGVDESWVKQDIKHENVDAKTLDSIAKNKGSYEAVFSKRALKYTSMGLKDKIKSDIEYRQYILDEYTFIQRPVVLIDDKIFVGNSKSTVAEIKAYLAN